MKPTTSLALVALLAFGAGTSLAQPPAAAGDPGIGRMHETMRQIRQTEDPEKRAELLEAHLNEMHGVMARMHKDLGELMSGVEAQKTETRRVHDHRRTKSPAPR